MNRILRTMLGLFGAAVAFACLVLFPLWIIWEAW